MTSSITPVMDSLFTALRAFLLDHLNLTACRQTQQNSTAMPTGNFAMMTPLGIDGLSTNSITYQFDESASVSSETHNRVALWRVQLDFYGDSAQENVNVISTITRSDYACQWFRDFANSSNGTDIPLNPVFCSDPKQTSMINGEDQWENRWTCDFHAQIPAAVTVPQQFMTMANVRADSVDAKFPPENG